MIARLALAAVTEALAGVTDPGEAVEILVARDLWPMEDAPVPWSHKGAVRFRVPVLTSIASLGLAAIASAERLAREVGRERGCTTAKVEWIVLDTVGRIVTGAEAELSVMGLDLEVDYSTPEPLPLLLTIIVPPLPGEWWAGKE